MLTIATDHFDSLERRVLEDTDFKEQEYGNWAFSTLLRFG